MANYNYKKMYAIKKQREDRIKEVCPKINNGSGIYVFYRTNEEGFKLSYIGQAKHLIERCAAHLAEYDHIALSLKKHGLYDEDKRPYGWKLTFKNYPLDELDEKEKATIFNYAEAGYQLYNSTSGSQGKGKGQIKERKPPKTYRQGIEQGKKNCSKDIAHLFDLHLDVSTKKNPPTVNQQKALDKFNDFLNYHKEEREE